MRKLMLLPVLFFTLSCSDGNLVRPPQDLGPVLAHLPSGPAMTVFNPYVYPASDNRCSPGSPNCSVFGAKGFVWLNGYPVGESGLADGEYFFAVLAPGGPPNPNDGGASNLSDDYDTYTNRTFTVTDGKISAYGGTHDLDSGATMDANRALCLAGCAPDGLPPFIQLVPFADTWNPGGGYRLAACSLANGYPVKPQDCAFGFFTIQP